MSQFIMDPDVYDAIDLVSTMEGGLVRGTPYVDEGEGVRCGCMIGAAHFAGVYGDVETAYDGYDAHRDLTPTYLQFDNAHRLVADHAATRRPWREIAKVMGVVRGTR